MITAQQIRAARGLLNWSQGKLAQMAGLTQRTITSIETSTSRLSFNNLEAIENVFRQNGIEFIEDGVRLKQQHLNVIRGTDFTGKTLDFVYNQVVDKKIQEIRLYGVNQSLLSPHEKEKVIAYVDKIYAFGAIERVLVPQSMDIQYAIGTSSRYRALPDAHFSSTNPTFIFGDYTVVMMFDIAETWVIDNQSYTETQRRTFDLLWSVGQLLE